MLQSSLQVRADSDGSRALAWTRQISLNDEDSNWFDEISQQLTDLAELDVIMMRKDPPFDMEYVTTTYLLGAAEQRGTLVVNGSASLVANNEKVAATLFPDCCPPTVIARRRAHFLAFLESERDIVVKPLDAMGGESIFRIRHGDPNTNVILETMTRHERRFIMAQQFIPEIARGDKRILLIDGEPVPYALARIPREGELRGNLAAGGTARGVPLEGRDRQIAERVGPYLREQGILFAGLDVIGDYLTEINITSPTCIRELDAEFGLDIAGDLMNLIERKLQHR